MELAELLRKIREEIVRELEIPSETLLDNVSLRTNYGLDSVAAVTIVFRLENELGLEIDVRKLAGVDTIDQLKHVLQGELHEKERHCLKKHG